MTVRRLIATALVAGTISYAASIITAYSYEDKEWQCGDTSVSTGIGKGTDFKGDRVFPPYAELSRDESKPLWTELHLVWKGKNKEKLYLNGKACWRIEWNNCPSLHPYDKCEKARWFIAVALAAGIISYLDAPAYSAHTGSPNIWVQRCRHFKTDRINLGQYFAKYYAGLNYQEVEKICLRRTATNDWSVREWVPYPVRDPDRNQYVISVSHGYLVIQITIQIIITRRGNESHD
jgi:Ni/Co efflux regulator RcnB